ncbi:hypothetical protein [Sphingobacterium sp. IITKGP-BTPF85]|uniref:hypothetical protein n=1 Tax=Sphingobacterium sp. IITKGP-BTPF85 TaxID=1338009 RepID=UPI00038A49C1|nr:hypothetical protein [Sphingobacterium sp. IITKGP-BTPF85]KKX46657.1 hypothetical protein L950_0230690 [Sphingobacterium sp. IITKGP-BTPF85]
MINIIRGGNVYAYLKDIFQPIYKIKNRYDNQKELYEDPVAKIAIINNVVQATNAVFGSQYSSGEGSLIVGDKVIPNSGLDCHSFVLSLPIQQRKNNEITEKYQIISKELAMKQQKISKQGVTQLLCRSLELSKKGPVNGNESIIKYQTSGNKSAMKYQTNGNELVINKQQNTTEIAENKLPKVKTVRRLINSDFFLTKLTPTSKFCDWASTRHRDFIGYSA